MTATITANAVVLTAPPPHVELTVAGMAGTTVTISRVDAAGNRFPVRTANPATLTSGGWVGFDYEAPFGQSVKYSAKSDTADTAVSSHVTVNMGQPWLIHPGIPALSQQVDVVTLGDRTTDTNQGVHVVLGRADPVVITDGVRRSPTFDLTLRTGTLSDEQALTTLLADASVLLLQVAYGSTDRTFYGWVGIGTVVQSNVVDWFGTQYLSWLLPCTVTDVPSGLLQATYTWADVIAQYATWADVIAAKATWRDLIAGS